MSHPHPPEVRFEFPDPTPIEAPVQIGRTPNTLDALIREARMRQALQAQLVDETFEESDDFDVVDDMPDYGNTRWEVAADAAALTPDELFERVYGITRAQAQEKLDQLRASNNPPLENKTGGSPAQSAPTGAP